MKNNANLGRKFSLNSKSQNHAYCQKIFIIKDNRQINTANNI